MTPTSALHFSKSKGNPISKNKYDGRKSSYVQHLLTDLKNGIKHNKLSTERLGASYQITDKTEIKELTELVIVLLAREVSLNQELTVLEKYDHIVDIYNAQVNISHRTSHSILLQQYSTPAPISYLAGVFVNADQNVSVFESSAGNGLLTIAARPEYVTVNEIDNLRRSNLAGQGYREVLSRDATIPFHDFRKRFDAVITNPPFGKIDIVREARYDNYPIGNLEHLMALRALDTMKDDGKAAIIIGGHNRYDKKGRFQHGAWRFFFNYLYRNYHVFDLINISGRHLFSRQGTSFNIRMILIDGRKETPLGVAPVANEKRDKVVTTFDELYNRVMANTTDKNMKTTYKTLDDEAVELLILLSDTDLGRTDRSSQIIRIMNEHFRIIEVYKGMNIVHDVNDVDDPVIHVHDPRYDILYTVALDDSKMAVPNKRILWKYNTLDAARRYIDRVTHNEQDDLGMPYTPASNACVVLDTVVPDSMGYETHEALAKIKQAIGGDMDEYVRIKLGYKNKVDLCKALSAEQIDAAGMAIYNIEERGQGMIIGDQTGIGKGRVAASIIRYATQQGVQPVFITEKANLFSDIYRDLVAIGSGNLVPFIVNAKESKTSIKDEDGKVVYEALPANEQQAIFESGEIPRRYDFIVATYSQFNSPEKKPVKPGFLMAIAEDNIAILDEAHNSSGSSNVGQLMQGVLSKTRGVVFLSATFAKRADNMPLYAMKTCIAEANMSREQLVEAITWGGVALQEVLASQLVAEGQMLRRERSFEGVEVNYITLTDMEQEHKAISDNITTILRDVIAFQTKYVDEKVDELDDIAVAEGKQVDLREGTSQAGVDNLPYFSKVFNVINQMLFSIKAEAVADRAIMRLKEGRKPVIAFASTMGSFLEQLENDKGMPVNDGDTIKADFSIVLQRGLEGILRYSETDVDGKKIHKSFSLAEFSPEARIEYGRIEEAIQAISTGITISPIDIIIDKLERAGYTAAEVTGRKYRVQLNTISKDLGKFKDAPDYGSGKQITGLVLSRKKINTNDAFRQFNNNEVDVLLINQSGSTGASAHAIATSKVPKDQVKQRVMIVLQPELDINTEVQKRGRINRTGQIMKPIYDYVNSAIPAEMRLMMMLQKKLKSLDANTTSNQKSSTKILDVPDFLNKIGDKVVIEYLKENEAVNQLLDDPISLSQEEPDEEQQGSAAHKVSGRVAVLSSAMQQEFYDEISNRYNDLVEYLKQIDEYDLEVEAMNLQAETIDSRVLKMGKGGRTEFGDDSILETVTANVLRKPFSSSELGNLINEGLQGKEATEIQRMMKGDFESFTAQAQENELRENADRYGDLVKEIANEKKIKKIQAKDGDQAYLSAIAEREKELRTAEMASENQIKTSYSNRRTFFGELLDFFYIGRNINYPVVSYDAGEERVFSVFLGFVIDKKKKNPYAPSAVKLRFAISNGKKYIAIPASYSKDINAIRGVSMSLQTIDLEQTLMKWDEAIRSSSVDRTKRYVITGNLLQAFGMHKGKLVSFTTLDGATRKGILLPENYDPSRDGTQKVIVPIERALKIIQSLTSGSKITTTNEVSIFRKGSMYKIVVSASRAKGGDIYLDEDILKLVDDNNFQKVSNSMNATIDFDGIDQFISILQNKFTDSVELAQEQYDQVKNEMPPRPKRQEAPHIKGGIQTNPLHILELEAQALELELELMMTY